MALANRRPCGLRHAHKERNRLECHVPRRVAAGRRLSRRGQLSAADANRRGVNDASRSSNDACRRAVTPAGRTSLVAAATSPFVRRFAQTRLLPVTFLVSSLSHAVGLAAGGFWGIDALIYYRGASAWLAGRDPWEAYAASRDAVFHFSALPTTVVTLAPFTILPEPVFAGAMIAAGAISALFIVRTLSLPWWWLLSRR